MGDEIQAIIPHRPPFLFVDKIVDVSENRIRTEKKIGPDESFFQGHYPGNPVMPGVLVCEAIFQSGVILVAKILQAAASAQELNESEGVPVLTRIREAKFKRMVLPGDLLEMEVELIEEMGGAFFLKGVARINGKVSVRVEFAATKANPNKGAKKT